MDPRGRRALARRQLRRQGDDGAGGSRSAPVERTEFNRSAARGLDILTAFTVGDQFLGNAEIAHRTGIPKPTVSRITATLTELGYLNYDDRIGKYEIGPRVLALSYSLLSKLQVHTHARPFMEELARESNCVVGLSILDGLNVVFIESALGDHPHARRASVGFRVPIAFTAMGWSCIAAMNLAERAETLRKIEAAYPKQAAEILRNIQQAIADVWKHGYCISLGALSPGSNAVGVPYLHPDGRHILAFNMTAPDSVLTRRAIETKWGPRLVRLVQRLSTTVAGRPLADADSGAAAATGGRAPAAQHAASD
ncbi:IclR family transcriptional regulator [Vineibacter terrae]|uniref:IclR family transcriptional regulator n=1 Tax=Vineibacter terrae TaxID=2586908 RepID=A0A5C8PCY9_9HYPH|nr:IclR family transcriptional regulator [Vineibacter terrae]